MLCYWYFMRGEAKDGLKGLMAEEKRLGCSSVGFSGGLYKACEPRKVWKRAWRGLEMVRIEEKRDGKKSKRPPM